MHHKSSLSVLKTKAEATRRSLLDPGTRPRTNDPDTTRRRRDTTRRRRQAEAVGPLLHHAPIDSFIEHVPVQLTHRTIHPDGATADLSGRPLYVTAELADLLDHEVDKPVHVLAEPPRGEDRDEPKNRLHMPGHATPSIVRHGENHVLEDFSKITEHFNDAADRVLFYISCNSFRPYSYVSVYTTSMQTVWRHTAPNQVTIWRTRS